MVFVPPERLEIEVISMEGVTLLVYSWADDEGANPSAPMVPRWSRAERAVLDGIRAGKTNAEIAEARGISIRTVANQAASLFAKVGVHSRSELLAKLASRRSFGGKQRMDSAPPRRLRVPQRSR